ncbi:MoxR family ATPase [Caballeronia novacaledonica]|uniref:AAA family ATPase n=1 Tax=Caballeronia novacaledonica TaxID=1544861 RepID=UPI001EE2A78B|nr:MoxR family ATPase [Caballeronia novacaledonica]GJH14325.1 MoxR family ATPase [Caballeronia novacaledonica]
MTQQGLFRGEEEPHKVELPAAPSWRAIGRGGAQRDRGETFRPTEKMKMLVDAALLLRRPLLITGKPGTGKSSLIYAVARELSLGPVLRWPVTSRSTLQRALYDYDAIGRMQEAQLKQNQPDIGGFIRLGPLGTALLPGATPRALLIDEIDKADIDLPNDLLDVFEEGEYDIPELARLKQEMPTPVTVRTFDGGECSIIDGHVKCDEFPFVILTSNGERDFAPAFLRRCLQLEMPEPSLEELTDIVRAHLREDAVKADALIEDFCKRRSKDVLATDQLLNAAFLVATGRYSGDEVEAIKAAVLKELARF